MKVILDLEKQTIRVDETTLELDFLAQLGASEPGTCFSIDRRKNGALWITQWDLRVLDSMVARLRDKKAA